MNDQQIMEDILMTTKGACDLYMHGTIESSTPQARQAIADAGYDPGFGARPLKRAIIRLVETAGLSSTAQLRLSSAVEQVTVTNLVEWKQGAELPIADNTVTLTLKPFEIRTLRLKMKD